jgi:vanillate O-demethylase monooxygenase subunit
MNDELAMKAGNARSPRNQWYVAAYSHEIGSTPLHRWLLDEPVVLFRAPDGAPVALFDRCPHRGLRLSAGSLVGDTIQCTYHGMRFDRHGACVAIPSGGPIVNRMCVRSFPVVEQWQWLWIWMGDPALADPALIPAIEPFGFGREGWFHETSGMLPVAANYLLPFENLLDASHITFLHHGLIDSGDVAGLPCRTEQDGHWLRVVREIPDEPVSPLTMKTFNFPTDRAHRSITADAHVPNLCGIRVDLAPAGKPAEIAMTNQLLVGITPATVNSCYEFTAVAQTFPFANQNREEDIRNLLMEDVNAMEDIQRLFDRLGPGRCAEVSVGTDAAAMRMRRLVAQMLAAEAG